MRQPTCEYCGVSFVGNAGPGRPRRFCCRAHRQRHYEMRKFSGDDRVTLLDIAVRSGFNCGICSGSVGMRDTGDRQPTIDHIVPTACGGANHADNLQLAHKVCNIRKRDRPGFTCEPPIDSDMTQLEAVLFHY